MIFKTVKGLLVDDHICTDDGTIWLTNNFKHKCNGYFLIQKKGFYYDVLKIFFTD